MKFRNEKGAMDLTSIIVSVVVIGILSSVVAATIFVLIPWAQDGAARNKLAQLSTSQTSYYQKADVYTNTETLVAENYFEVDPSLCTRADATEGYVSEVKSQTGKVFRSTKAAKEPVEVAPADVICFTP